MTYVYKQQHLDKTSHNLTYKYGREFMPTQITYHQTSNKASAQNERDYLNSRTDKVYIGFHLVVDDSVAIECLPLSVQTWHAGDGYGDGNMKSLGIEIAYSTSSSTVLRDASIVNGAHLIATLMLKYNVSMNNVLPHQARSGKHCPHDILDRYGNDKFRALIQSEYNTLARGNNSESEEDTSIESNTTHLYKQYDQIVLTSSTLGYMSSTSEEVVKTLAAGTYKVYKYVETGIHRLNVSKTGETPDVWINIPSVNSTENINFKQYDPIILVRNTPGYMSSTSDNIVKTLPAGTYKVYKYVETGTHRLNVSTTGAAPDVWIDTASVSINGQLKAGDKVTVSRDVYGYNSSSDTKASTTLKSGTYFVYKFAPTAMHPINISNVLNIPGAWVDDTYVTKK